MTTIFPVNDYKIAIVVDDDEPYPNSLARFAEGENPIADEIDTSGPTGFWQRQFQEKPTEKQIAYDWTFGVLLPLACFFFDPLVFRSGFLMAAGPGLLAGYKAVAYPLAFGSILAMTAWLLWREKLGIIALPLSGLFAVSSLASLLVGVILFPFSLIGMFMLIGFLGFTPLFSTSSIGATRCGRLIRLYGNDKS